MKENPTSNKSKTSSNRRRFLQLGAFSAMGSFSLLKANVSEAANPAALPVSQPPLPRVDARFPCRIADGIWIIPDKRIPLVPNIGIVEGSKSVLVIDCGLTPESGSDVLTAAHNIAGKRELILTVTHAHPVPFFPPLIQGADINCEIWQAALTKISDGAPLIIVPGHGNLGGTEIAKQISAYLEATRKLVASSGADKAAGSEWLGELESRIRDEYPTWERAEFIAPALRYFIERADA
jgi:glyoxylase-like metal-dependent hydrolase (beta-lactamase superfamily II)